jgi:hypothetical protein
MSELDKGVVTVLKPAGKSLAPVFTSPEFGERIAATPAIADDTLYLRTSGTLYAFKQK